jgi:mRNA interferase RelE/StbE
VKDLRRIDSKWQKKILLAIDELAQNPFNKGNVKKLVNSPYYRLRVGDYRVVYDIQRSCIKILVIHIGKRGDVYR